MNRPAGDECRASDCCLTPTRQFFRYFFFNASSLKQQSTDRHVAPTRTHYPDSQHTSLNAACIAQKQQIPIL